MAEGETFASSPLIDFAGNVYAASSKALHKLDGDGVLQWKLTYSTISGAGGPSHPSFGLNGNVHFASSTQTVYSVQPNGTVAWTFVYANADTDSSPAVGATGTIYQTFGVNVVAISQTGSQQWV